MLGFWYVVSTFKRTVFLSDAVFQEGHRLEEYLGRMAKMLVDPETTYHKDYSKKTGHILRKKRPE